MNRSFTAYTLAIGLTLGTAGTSFAEDYGTNAASRAHVRGICTEIAEKNMVPNGDGHVFGYVKMIYKAAGVWDEVEARRRKADRRTAVELTPDERQRLSRWWLGTVNSDAPLICPSTEIAINNPSILFLAVKKGNYDLLIRAAEEWDWYLDAVNPHHCMTLLDYFDEQVAENRGNSLGPNLREYRDIVRAAGARRLSEMKVDEIVPKAAGGCASRLMSPRQH